MKTYKIEDFRKKYVFSEIVENFILDFVVDLTNDVIIDLQGKVELDIDKLSFSELVKNFANNTIYCKEVSDFGNFFNREKIIISCLEKSHKAKQKGNVDKKSKQTFEFRYKSKEGELKWALANLSCFKKQDIIFAYVFIQDINDQKKKLTDLIFKADHDALTKLKNKSSIETAINKYLLTQGIEGLHALFCFDIDNFKNINNSFGHVFGDVFLVETANTVKKLFRKDDILGRIGGDEFVIFMKDIGYRHYAFRKANEIIESVRNAFIEHGEAFNTTISIGIAFYDDNNKSYSELLKEADTAMYYCKNSGKNKYAEYNIDMDATTLIKSGMDTVNNSSASEQNANEYIFRVLRDNQEKEQAFNLAFKLISMYFDIDNISIYEIAENRYTYSYSKKSDSDFEFGNLEKLEVDDNYLKSFDDGAFFYSSNQMNVNPKVEAVFINAQCASAIHFTILHQGKVVGVMCFNRYNSNRKFVQKDMIMLRNIANLLYCRMFCHD